VLDEERVRSSVARFGQILQGLSRDEQKALVGAFVDRIDVRSGAGDVGTSMFVSVRRLELRMKLNLPRLIDGMEDRLLVEGQERQSLKSGMVITAQVALGQQGRANQSLILTPFRCGDEQTVSPTAEAEPPKAGTADHPILQARTWQRMMAEDSELSLRRLAEQEGEVPPTLVRHFKLLKLAPDIQESLARMRDRRAIHFFSLRRLRPLAAMGDVEQRRAFRQMQAEFNADISISSEECSVAVRSQQTTGNRIRIS
jgi:hypothetical protein